MPKSLTNTKPKASRSPSIKPPPRSVRRSSSSKSIHTSPAYDSAAEDIIVSEDETIGPSTTVPSEQSIHGQHVLVGQDVWSRFVSDNGVIIDKSLAIEHLLAKGCTVMTGLAPRGYGKTTFLTMLREFLALESAVPKQERLNVFKDYELYQTRPSFFRQHFAKYPVFYIDFKTAEVNSVDEAFYTIVSKIVEISRPYIMLLKEHMKNPKTHSDKGKFFSLSEKIGLINNIFNRYQDLPDFQRPYAKIETRQFLPQLMHVLSRCPGGANSVVIVDNYDTPGYHATTKLVGYSNGIADTLTRDQVMHEFGAFYGELFKSNDSLKLGILAGVYNIPLYHMSPGRNDYKVFQSHHGVGSASDSSNPFDSAFGFSEAEVWNLVCNHVEQHAFGKTLTYQTQLKKELVAYMFKNIDWSTYGTKQYCFNTRSVMRFLESIEGYDSLVQIQGSILDHQMRLRETLDTNTLHITEPYRFKHLIEGPMLEFLTRREFHFGNPSTMGTLEAEFRAQGIEFLSHSAFRDVPFKVHDEALTCMVPMCLSVDQSRIMECSPRGLCLESTFCQLYQAGYLALINGHVCITNNESFEALLAILHSRCPNPGHSIWTLSPALYDTGIHNGDLIKFARFMDNHLRSRAEFPLTHPIETYMCFISALLTPLRYQGCTVHMEPKPADGGMLDIIIMRDVPIDPHADPVQEQRKLPQIVIKVQMPIQPEFIKPNYEIPVDHRKNAFNQAVKTSKSILMAMRMRRLNFQPPGVPLHTFITLSFMYNRFFLCATRYIGNSGQPMTSSWKAYPYDENDTRGVTSSRIGYNIHKGHLIASTFLS